MNQLQQASPSANPMPQTPDHVNAGTAATEQSRAVAEALGKLEVAKRFPRDEHDAYTRIMAACSRRGFAESALYAYPKGGQQVTGPSIRMAEMLLRNWGNAETGIKELSQKNGESEMLAYAWDLQSNTYFVKNFVVKHERATKFKTIKLTDARDIYEIGANNGARRQRATILAIIPDDIVEEAVKTVKATLAGNSSEPIADRIRKMISAFNKHGVTAEMIEKYIGHESSLIDADEIVELMGVYNSINSGSYKPSQYFSDLEKKEKSAVVDDVSAKAGPAPAEEPKTTKPKREI